MGAIAAATNILVTIITRVSKKPDKDPCHSKNAAEINYFEKIKYGIQSQKVFSSLQLSCAH